MSIFYTKGQVWAQETEALFRIKTGQIHLVPCSPQQPSCEIQKYWTLEMPLQQPYKACSSNPLPHPQANTYSTSVFICI